VRQKSSVSVILPAFNEESNVADMARRCIEACEKHFARHEIIVVDDGSADGTAQVTEELSASEPRIKLVRHPHNRGYGAALRSGFDASGMEWIFFTDTDGQFDPGEMSIMIQHLADYDIVAGYRMRRQDNIFRRGLGWTFTKLVNLFFGVRMRDVDCAFKFLRGDLIRSLPLTSEGPLINTEILFHARKKGWKVIQLGVHHYPRRSGEQTGANPIVILKAIREHWKLFFRLRAMKNI